MKIILLRHEERYSDIGFFSNLTDNGIINACKLPKKLKKYKIDHIFSSPFIRTIQTIFPYCDKYNKKINIEYGLYEYIHNLYFLLVQWYHDIEDIKDNDLHTIINKNYKTNVTKDDFSILETEEDLAKRIKKFIDFLKQNYNDKTILLVSHMGIINKIKDLYVKKTDMRDLFNMGHYEIYDI
jgi:broad specificity phosphatase PhoE